jgi:hypothetical protein
MRGMLEQMKEVMLMVDGQSRVLLGNTPQGFGGRAVAKWNRGKCGFLPKDGAKSVAFRRFPSLHTQKVFFHEIHGGEPINCGNSRRGPPGSSLLAFFKRARGRKSKDEESKAAKPMQKPKTTVVITCRTRQLPRTELSVYFATVR